MEIDEFEASLIYIVPGQLGLPSETVSKIETKASDLTTVKKQHVPIFNSMALCQF